MVPAATDGPPPPSPRPSPRSSRTTAPAAEVVYRVAPHEGLRRFESVVIAHRHAAAAGVELRIFGSFVLPLLLILVSLLGLLVRSFPGPGDLEILELAVDQPVHVAADPDPPRARRHLVGARAEPRRRRAHRRRHVHAAGGSLELTGAASTRAASTRATRRLPLDLDEMRRALETATRRRDARGKIDALNLDYAARGLEPRRRSGTSPARAAERARSPRWTSSGPRRASPSTRPCAAACSSPACSVWSTGRTRGARSSRRGSAARRRLRLPRARDRRGGRKDARLVLYYDRVPLAPRPQDDPARRLPARLPLPAQPPAGRQLTRMRGASSSRARRARATARGALPAARPRAGARRRAPRGSSSTRWHARGPSSVVLGPRLPDVPMAEAIGAPRGCGGPAGLDPRADPRFRLAATEGVVLGAGANAALRRPLERSSSRAGWPKLLDVRGACSARIPVHVQVWAAARARRRALLRAQPQPRRPRDALASPVRIEAEDLDLEIDLPEPEGRIRVLARIAREAPEIGWPPTSGPGSSSCSCPSPGSARSTAWWGASPTRGGAEPLGSRAPSAGTPPRPVVYEVTGPTRPTGLPGGGPPRRARGLAPSARQPLLRRAGRSTRQALDTAREFVRRHR